MLYVNAQWNDVEKKSKLQAKEKYEKCQIRIVHACIKKVRKTRIRLLVGFGQYVSKYFVSTPKEKTHYHCMQMKLFSI